MKFAPKHKYKKIISGGKMDVRHVLNYEMTSSKSIKFEVQDQSRKAGREIQNTM